MRKHVNHKTKRRINKVIEFLRKRREQTKSIVDDKSINEYTNTDDEYESIDEDKVLGMCLGLDKSNDTENIKTKWMPSPHVSVMGNDITRWDYHTFLLSINGNDIRTGFEPDNVFDKMDDEFLQLFEAGKRHNIANGAIRRQYMNECTLDPMTIKHQLRPIRLSLRSRLEEFERRRANRKCKKLTENERQAIVRQIRTEKAKSKFLNRMEFYLLYKLGEQRTRIREEEKLKYEKYVEKYKEEIAEKEKKILQTLNENLEKILKREKEKAKLMRIRLLVEGVFRTAEAIETETKGKYETFLLKLNTSELLEMYQIDMNEYCKFWKMKAQILQKKVEEEEKVREKRKQLYEMHTTLHCITNIERYWKEKARKHLKRVKEKIRKVVVVIPQKEKELNELKEKTSGLQKQIGHWKKIVPGVLNQLEKFIKFSFKDVLGKDKLLECINKLRDFEEPTLDIEKEEKQSTPSISQNESSSDDLIPIKETKTLLKVKHILKELLRKVIPSDPTILLFTEGSKDFMNQVNANGEICLENESQSKATTESKEFTDKLNQIVDLIDDTFLIFGDQFSSIEVNPEEFFKRREKSMKEIINKVEEKIIT